MKGEEGFTLIELLVVMLVIGLLAAIAIPSFFNQKEKGDDAGTLSDVRNVSQQVLGCYLESSDYTKCTNAAQLKDATYTYGTGANQMQVLPNPLGSGGVAVTSLSGSGTTFATYSNGGTTDRICIPAAGAVLPKGACKPGGSFAAFGWGYW